MPRILAIDDEQIVLKLISRALEPLGYEVITAPDGLQGLTAARLKDPDLIITDVVMPKLDGYEVTRRLRREPKYARTPILVLSGQANLEQKLKAFEAGADDYMAKPFESAELAARVGVLLRRGEAAKAAQEQGLAVADQARVIVVQSLRGGIGCSSMAVNIALALNNLWGGTTLLIDLVFAAGQAALMLDMPLRRTWADVSHFEVGDLDFHALQTVTARHESGLRLIAAPTYPTEAEEPSGELIELAFRLLRPHYNYIVVDLPRNFNAGTLQALDAADVIILLLAPELASVRAAVVALDTYAKLGFDTDKVKLVLNWTFERHGLARKNIEEALQLPINLVVPFAPDRFVGAINQGRPVLSSESDGALVALFEDFAYQLSKQSQRDLPPAAPTKVWQRVNKRLAARAKKKK